MKSLVLSLIAGLAFALAVSTAEAGGGTKPNSTIKVTNNTGTQLAVIVDPSNTVLGQINAGTITEADFKKAGGQIVDDGVSAFFSVKAGAHVVGAAEITEAGIGDASTANVTTTKGKTKTIVATDDGGDVILTVK